MLRRARSKRNASSGNRSDDDNMSKDSNSIRSRSKSPGSSRAATSSRVRGRQQQQGAGNGIVNRFKISDRLDKVLELKTPVKKNRSPDLVPLTKDYEDFKKKLRSLVTTSKTYHEATKHLDKSRTEMFNQLSVLSENTPLHKHIGKRMDEKALTQLKEMADTKTRTTQTTENLVESKGGSFDKTGDVASEWKRLHKNGGKEGEEVSFATLQQLAETQGEVDSFEFQSHVLDYIVEWERVIVTRIDNELEETKKYQLDRTHYEEKVEKLRKTVNEMEEKGKPVSKAFAEKLERNEEKLKEAWETHEASAGRSCVLIEAATQTGWRDLYPLVKITMKWESNRCGRVSDIYSHIPKSLEAMKTTYNSSGNSGGGKKSSPNQKKKKGNNNATAPKKDT